MQKETEFVDVIGMPYQELKQKSCLCYNHLMGQETQFPNLFCLEIIFKNYRASYAKKEALNNQINEVNDILRTANSITDQESKIFAMFRRESPLLKTMNVLIKLGNQKFLDFSSSLLKLMLKSFSNNNNSRTLGNIEVYRGLYVKEDLLDSLDKYFIKNEYMFFNDVS